MERNRIMGKNRFLSIGLFVLVGFTMIVGILLWFSASNRQSYNNYTIIFHEAVDGLSTSSIVKYNGVEVGKVSTINLDTKDPNNIIVNFQVLSNILLSNATYGTVKSQGITGMSYVALAIDQSIVPVNIKPHNDAPYPMINSKTSLLTTITEQAQKIGTNIGDISVDIKHLLNESNINHVAHVIENIDTLTTAIASQANSIESSMRMVSEVLYNVNQNAKNLDVAILHMAKLSTALESNSAQLGIVLDTVQNQTLTSINTVLLPNVNQSVINMNGITSQFNDLLRTVNNNPAVFIRGTVSPQAGPRE